MRNQTLRGALFAAVIAAAGLCGPAAAQPTMKIGFASINDVQHEFARRFAAEMGKRAPGRLTVQVYPAEQLGSIPRMLEGLTLGTVEAWIGAPEFLVGQDPRYQIMGAPGIVADMEHGYRLVEDRAFREALLSFGDARGIKGIGANVYGPVVYATRKPIRTLADFQGMKIRVFPSPMHTVAMDKLGATGTPMNPADTLIALASGAMDASRAGLSFLVTFKYFDIVKSATYVQGDAMSFAIFAVGKNWFDKLPADLQKSMLEVAAGLEREITDFAVQSHRKSEDAWRQSGADLFVMGGAEQAEFIKRMRSVGDEVAAKNPRIKDAYNLMVKRAEATRR